MDPNANLAEQRRIVARLIECQDREDVLPDSEVAYLAFRLADLVEALDGWIKGGGFLPDSWQKARG